MKLLIQSSAALLIAACAGCRSFEAERTSHFVDEENRAVLAEFAHGDEHESFFTAPNGAKMPYKSRQEVRVTMPDGTRFHAYRNLSLVGILYVSDDGEWKFFEEGTGCAVARRAENGDGYLLVYNGLIRATPLSPEEEARKRKARITGSSTPRGFGREGTGPRDSSGPRTADESK